VAERERDRGLHRPGFRSISGIAERTSETAVAGCYELPRCVVPRKRDSPVAPRAVSLNFASWREATADMSAFARRVLFDFLPAAEQASCWEALRAECDRRNELERRDPLLYDPSPPPKRHQPARRSTAATSTRPGTVALSRSEDPLKQVPPAVYFEAIAGVVVPPSGWVSCPLPDHSDRHPSYQVLSTHWRCFGCGRGGGVIDLASALHGIEPRGRGYWRLRDLILERLLWAPLNLQEEDE
jgi:hypothetical protein